MDISPAHDYPCDLEGSNAVGGGIGIKICDPSVVCDEDIVAAMEDCCEKEHIKYQREVIDKGGTRRLQHKSFRHGRKDRRTLWW